MKTLSDIGRDQSCIVIDFDPAGKEPSIKRLMELGFTPDETVKVTHIAPLGGDPIAVRVGSATIALRKKEAALIHVRLLNASN